jgi:hypothetical protein
MDLKGRKDPLAYDTQDVINLKNLKRENQEKRSRERGMNSQPSKTIFYLLLSQRMK